jgi:hypothetical protein
MASLVRGIAGIARLVGLGGTADAATAEAATEEALEAYLRDEDDEPLLQDSDVDSDDDVGGLVQDERDASMFPLYEFPNELPEVINVIPGACPSTTRPTTRLFSVA